MPQVMLRPNWPSERFRRTVPVGKKPKRFEFLAGQPVAVSPQELDWLRANGDLGAAIFEVEPDSRGKIRFVETEPAEETKDVANVQ